MEMAEAMAPACPRKREFDLGAPLAQPHGGHDLSVVMLLRLRDQMKQKLTEYSAALRTGQTVLLDDPVEEHLIRSTIADMESDIKEKEVSFRNKMLALQRIQSVAALRNKCHQDDKDSRLILETTKHIMLLSRTIIKYKKQAREKEQQLTDIKRKRLTLKNEERQKLQEIKTMKKKTKEEQESGNLTEATILFNLEKEKQMTTVLQNVFQNIIIGSRVNWVEDPSLKKIVLQLEKNVQPQ